MMIMNPIRNEIKKLLSQTRALTPDQAWPVLAEAHILSQPYAWMHVLVHWEMWKLAWRTKNAAELRGQFVRLLVAAPGSVFGKYPLGNTGLSNVSMFLPMEIPTELKVKIENLSAK